MITSATRRCLAFTIVCMLIFAHCTSAESQAVPDSLAVEQALAGLHSPDWIIQAESASLLASYRVPEAAGKLRELQRSNAPALVRGRALVAIAEISGEKEVDFILAQMQDETDVVRAAAVEALAITGSQRGVPAVLQALKDPSDLVKVAALRAAADMNIQETPRVVASVVQQIESVGEFIQAMEIEARLLGVRALETTLDRLADPHQSIRIAAVRALSAIDDDAARKKLISLLSHEEYALRREAVRCIGERKILEAIPVLLPIVAANEGEFEQALAAYDPVVFRAPLVDALQSDDKRAVALALRLLARKPSAEVGETVAEVVNQSADAFMAVFRHKELRALARFSNDSFNPFFISYLRNTDINPHYRLAAIECLMLSGSVNGFEVLRKTVLEDDALLRVHALEHLTRSRVAPEAGIVAFIRQILGDHNALQQERRRRWDALTAPRRNAPGLFSMLSTLLFSTEPDVRHGAARHLARKVRRAAAAFQLMHDTWREDQIAQLCVANIRAHVTRGEVSDAIELLEPFLRSADAHTRNTVAGAVAGLSGKKELSRITTMQGYVVEWMVCSTFPNDHLNAGLEMVYPPETIQDFDQDYGEQPFMGFGAYMGTAEPPFDIWRGDCILMHPGRVPSSAGGSYAAVLLGAFNLPVPLDAESRFKASVAFDDRGANSGGFRFAVWVDGRQVERLNITERHKWFDVDVDLSAFRGRRSLLELEVQPLRNAVSEYAYISRARITAGNALLADLNELLPEAKSRIIPPGPRGRRASWQSVSAANGVLSFFEFVFARIGFSTAYAVADIVSPDSRKARVEVESSDDHVVFVNGERLVEPDSPGRRASGVVITLNPGRNRIMVKTVNRWSDNWWLRARVSRPDGASFEDIVFRNPSEDR